MKTDYSLNGPSEKLEVEVEVEVLEKLAKMENYTEFTKSELVNTALKRFIVTHKDFLPPT